MFAAEFEYRKAGSIAEAVQLLSDNPGAKILAGGHSLIPLMRFRLARPEVVIDIGGIANLRGITVSGDTINIGALTTHAEIAASADVQRPTACWPRRPAASAIRRSATGEPSGATWPTRTRRPTGPRCSPRWAPAYRRKGLRVAEPSRSPISSRMPSPRYWPKTSSSPR